MRSSANRIDYIDLAKGICILLVVFHHVANFYRYRYGLCIPLQSFRMPLYYILSGIFFKQYDGFVSFMKRKTNKLLIPFLFFYFVFSIPLTVLRNGKTFIEALSSVVNGYQFENGSIWFLLSLFEVNLVFYFLIIITKKTSFKGIMLASLSILCGIMGLLLSMNEFGGILFFDTSLTVVPFFYFGYLLGRGERKFLLHNYRWWQEIAIVVFSFSFIMCFSSEQDFGNNYFSDYYFIYPCGILGTVLVLVISKRLIRLPLVSYIGRYSIIVLCTHMLFMKLIKYKLLNMFVVNTTTSLWLDFLLTIIMMLLVIPLCRKFIPYFTAQSDLIKV